MSPDPGPSPQPPPSSPPRDDTVSRQRLVGALVALVLVAAIALAFYLRATERFDATPLATRYGNAVGLDPALVLAVIEAESGSRPRATAKAGARGRMQLLPAPAQEIARRHSIPYRGPDDLFDPDLNVRLGTLYLARLRRQFADEPYLYLAAYNAGPGNLDKWRRQHPGLPPQQLIAAAAFPQTRAYVRRVMERWQQRR